jgi:uncharacterized LabA/DUF88 family protein
MIFIDGSNMYHSLKHIFGRTDVDIGRFCQKLLNRRRLIRIYYYNAKVGRKEEPERYQHQQAFFAGVNAVPYLELRLGRLVYFNWPNTPPYEKGTDVQLTTDMLTHSFKNNYDVAILVAGDNDYVGALQAACTRLRGLSYDLAGARRATAMVSLLEARTPGSEPLYEPLRELHVELQRLTVHRALAAGLQDRAPFERSGSHSGWDNPRVRATAVTACVEGLGEPTLAEMLALHLGPGEPSEVLLALVQGVERNGGLPLEASGLAAEDRSDWEQRWIDSFVALATTHPVGQVRVGAMRALGVISGGELTSLREEDWLA